MITIAEAAEKLLLEDDVALEAARRGVLNLSSYSRLLQSPIAKMLVREVKLGTITTALSRIVAKLPQSFVEPGGFLQGLVVHSNLEGITYERSIEVAAQIQDLYHSLQLEGAFLTVTNGVNEITVITEIPKADLFRSALSKARIIYDKSSLVGITVKIKVGNLEVPNIIYLLTRRLAYKRINIIEVVSTATELTYIIEKNDLAIALGQLQKDI